MTKIIKEAITAAGSVTALSKLLGIKPQAISQWAKIPPAHVLKIEKATGISRHKLRPDIFGRAP